MTGLNMVVVGTGMYTCGTGTDQFGTVMPAVCEWARSHPIENVYVVGTRPVGVQEAQKKISELQQKMDIHLPLTYFPVDHDDPKAYHQAFQKIPKPACALIVVPDKLHREVAGAAMEQGLHCLVVKPLASSEKEVRELIALQKECGVYGYVEFHKRFDNANRMLRDVILKGSVGDPLYFLVEFSQRKTVPTKHFKKWVSDTNIFQYLGIHYVDMIHYLTKALPRRVMGVGQTGWLLSQGIDTYDSVQGIIEWEMPSGHRFSSHILTHWIDPESTSAMSDQTIKVIGTKGRCESDQKKRGMMIVTDDSGVQEPNPYFTCAYGKDARIQYEGYGIQSVHQFFSDVTDILQKKKGVVDFEGHRPTFRESLIPTQIMEGVQKSLQNNSSWIPLEGTPHA